MPLAPQVLLRWIGENGPFLAYHGKDQSLPWIRRDGLLCRSDSGQPTTAPEISMASRPGHVYLGTRRAGSGAAVGGYLCDVDLRMLDPALMDSNEDCLGAHHTVDISALPDDAKLDPLDANRETGGGWADRQSELIDRPEWVEFSLAQGGSLAYRGNIGREALRIPRRALAEWAKAKPGDPYVPRRWQDPMPYQRVGPRKTVALIGWTLWSPMRWLFVQMRLVGLRWP